MVHTQKPTKRKGNGQGPKQNKKAELEKSPLILAKQESKPSTQALEGQRKSPRKRAADMFEDRPDESNPTPPLKKSKSKVKSVGDSGLRGDGVFKASARQKPDKQESSKTSEVKIAGKGETSHSSNGVVTPKDAPKATGLKSKKSKGPSAGPENVISDPEETTDHAEKVDDVTAEERQPLNNEQLLDIALYGFTSSEDSSEESDEDKIAEMDLPKPPQISEAARQEVVASRKGRENDNGPGVLYIGRIPHGFYEHQMRSYFSQFGTITRLRLARNRKTGQSKHYAFIEFEDAEVADIVQRVMDKYLLFSALLQVRRISPDDVRENLFKGANTRFKKIPWGDIQARGLKMPAERELWERRILREEQRREKKKKINDEYGYDFEMPNLKRVKDLPSRAARTESKDRQALENLDDEKSTELVPVDNLNEAEKELDKNGAIEDAKDITVEEKKPSKEKKSKKAKRNKVKT